VPLFEECGKRGTTAVAIQGMVATANCGQRVAREEEDEDDDDEVDSSIDDGQNKLPKAPRNVYYGDSWFAGVRTAEEHWVRGHEFCGPVKTAHSFFPKDEIEKLMKPWPSGTSIVMEATGFKVSLLSPRMSAITIETHRIFFYARTRGLHF